ncbi:DctP family TRAP transporter solute-binding subunit [Paenibacillus sp.]|uniref:DctP family TRAP transporter solute-binding subunit n=1 Tax=Paenibacillus sp. TaxID=58172 RepID=UPI002D4157EB|nr:DctP family TRAP transporter solute-binding subunit [Paenibacillus sp.]HZG84021.1 DctP family TRAP transporter solute-binding subunit [Paenibacillus sp.]
MNGKEMLLPLLVALFLFPTTGCIDRNESASNGGGKEVQDKIVLRFAEVNSESDPIVSAIRHLADTLQEISEGRIVVDVFTSGQLGDHLQVIQSLRMGAVDLTRTQPSYLADAGVKGMHIYSLPYLFRDVDHVWKTLEGEVGSQLLNDIQASGSRLVGIGYYATSPRDFFFRSKQVTRLSDMKGLKVRVPSGQIYNDMVHAFGADPVPIEFDELYSALQTGEVDGAEQPIKGYHSGKYYEIAGYYTVDQHIADPSVILISEMTWSKLSMEDRRLILDATASSVEFFKRISAEQDAKAMEELKAAGVQFSEIEDPEQWWESVQPLYKKYGEGYEELIEKIRGIQ